jgi:hypothetical protein
VDVTTMTWGVGIGGLVLMGLLGALQAVALVRPRSRWTIENVYGGEPERTDPVAYFAFNRGYALADVALWLPLQVAASIGMLLGQEWGFVLGVAASVPFIYTAVNYYIWDRDLGFRKDGLSYWVVTWSMWPVFGVIQGVYAFGRLVA